MVKIYELFLFKELAERFREDYLQRYHPAGYGTLLECRLDRQTGHWIVAGSRFSSCD